MEAGWFKLVALALFRWGAADELHLVAVRVIHVHGAAGENRMLAAARL